MHPSGRDSPVYQPAATDDETPKTSKPPSEKEKSPLVKWGIGWKTPACVLLLLVISIVCAVAHHIYYQRLDHTVVLSKHQQTRAIQVGTVLAILSRASLTIILGIVATQQIWFTLRRKSMSLSGIDCMFQIMTDPSGLLNPHMWTRAKTLLLLAVTSWFLPIIQVFPPATLSVRSSTTIDVVSQFVPTVNYTNMTGWATYEGVGRIDKPTFEITRVFSSVFTSASYLTLTPSYPNSSYDLKFWGPSYKCSSLEEVVAKQNSPTWDTDIYNYTSLQDVWDELVIPDLPGPQNSYRAYSAAAPNFLNNMILIWSAGHNTSSSNTSIICQLYNTSYDVSMRFDEGVQSIAPISIEYLDPLDWDSSTGTDSLLDGNDTLGTSYVTHLLFSDLLGGNVTVGSTGSMGGTSTMLLQSGLISCPEIWNSTQLRSLYSTPYSDYTYCRNRTLSRAIEDLSRNFTYSTIASNYGRVDAKTKTPITIKYPQNIYSYDMKNLLISYLVGIVVTLLWIGMGFVALWKNGVASSTSFSTVLLTTRNEDLNRLAEGNSLGADPLPRAIGKETLMFGRFNDGGSAGFGFEGTVTPIRKGEELR